MSEGKVENGRGAKHSHKSSKVGAYATEMYTDYNLVSVSNLSVSLHRLVEDHEFYVASLLIASSMDN